MSRSDEGHRLTDKELEALECRIAAEYRKAAKELQEKIDAYFDSFKERDAKQKKLIGTVINGKEYTENDYRQWRLAQIGRGKRFEALRDRVAERMTKANEVAAAYINDATPGIYSLNRNYAAYTIEQQTGANAGFDLWDEQTVKRLIVEQPDLMPYYPPKRAVKRGIDLAWGKRQITAQITSGILQGESIKHLADRLQKNIPTMNRTSAIRAARTAVTGAQNAGRQDGYDAAVKMGIEMEKQWLATLDGRTRHDHAAADGQRVAEDKSFIVGGYKLMYPGDPSGPGHEIYNCRCTMIAQVKGVDMSDAKRRARDPVTGESEVIENMSYVQWLEMKKQQHGEQAVETSFKRVSNEVSDRKQFESYKSVLGKDAPKSFTAFQDLKYNDSEKWEQLKTTKRQTDFVNNAPCVTTPKKYTGYFLKPGAKHSDDFFNVGYMQDNPLQLRYDMAQQFDMEKSVNNEILEDGAEKFNIYMELGITKKRMFKTGWRIDKPGDKPRIITAFRRERE